MYSCIDDKHCIIVDFYTCENLDYPFFFICNHLEEINEYGSFEKNKDGSITIHSDHYKGYTGTFNQEQLTISDGNNKIEL